VRSGITHTSKMRCLRFAFLVSLDVHELPVHIVLRITQYGTIILFSSYFVKNELCHKSCFTLKV
jgi:hypothetical protein